ncbi:LysR family transcriptional regulator [Paenarthrobacter ilicis]|uniref:DNA-binding transcriptional LysR family regulator n=1 Tax=Paenarthrobacter ilicis TaxID=43665 RepID=A0ABX0TBE3_9MICC|nr:LysR family transcriptional regulator [Paenarthrobacter ilicis]MBM7793598.1 DNA-binding transcriptional LysR family regulator [Paenarthrobacter ilicis]NII99778.1 DNA-binding transcriptional LysR family regulator [Paenarthrobacter ilicis]
MDFKRLQILRELADRQSVGATAEAMNVTPSAVSQQLKTLQEEIGVVLMEKVGRGVQLTEAGQAMAAAAADIAAAMARAESTMETYRSGWQAKVSVAFFPSAAEMLLPGLLHRVLSQEGLTLDAHFEDPGTAHFAPLVADYDLVLAHSVDGPEVFARPGLTVVPLLEEALDVAMPAGHPLAAMTSLRPGDVIDYPWIGVPEGFPFDTVLRQVELRAGRKARRGQRYPDLRVLEALVGAGHGICLLPRYTARASARRGLVLRPLTGVKASRSIVALARQDVAARATISGVLAMLRDEAAAIALELDGSGPEG